MLEGVLQRYTDCIASSTAEQDTQKQKHTEAMTRVQVNLHALILILHFGTTAVPERS